MTLDPSPSLVESIDTSENKSWITAGAGLLIAVAACCLKDRWAGGEIAVNFQVAAVFPSSICPTGSYAEMQYRQRKDIDPAAEMPFS